jgi:hypothetical protein
MLGITYVHVYYLIVELNDSTTVKITLFDRHWSLSKCNTVWIKIEF